jgi:hypothetical protein
MAVALTVAFFSLTTGTAAQNGGGGTGPKGSASAVSAKKFKKLKQQVADLSARLAALEATPTPTSLPPSGPAGGDLTGIYPNPLIGPDAVGSAEIADGTLTRSDAAQGTLVTAYARINNPPGNGNATIAAASAVNVPDIDVINETLGNFIVTFTGLPGDSLATCTIIGQPVFDGATLQPLPRRTTMVATGGGMVSATSAQVQTLDNVGSGVESDFYIQVSCPPG